MPPGVHFCVVFFRSVILLIFPGRDLDVFAVSSENNPQSYLKLTFDVFEHFEEAASSWDLAFHQLGPADQPYQLEQIATGQLIYNRSAFFSRFHQMGGSPPGYRTFTLLAPGSREFRWCGENITGDVLLVMPESGEFESISPPGLDTFHVSLNMTLLAKVACEQFDCDLVDILGSERIFSSQGGSNLRRLRHLLHQVSRRLPQGVGEDKSVIGTETEHHIAYLVLAILQQGSSAPRGPRSRRMRAASRALEILQDSEGRVCIPELVAATGVSRRTLETAFQDILGVSPASYIKARRLQSLRVELTAARTSSTSVGQLAQRFGFGHGGQLAADYTALYGEPPGVTFRR